VNLLLIALAPVLIIAVYIYFRDKYEKEPIGLLLLSLLAGALVVIPVLIVESLLTQINPFSSNIPNAAYNAFVVAGFTEEFFKWLAIVVLLLRNKNFDQYFDGIVYAVFVSLGFAAIENVFYVVDGGLSVGALRAFTAVPLHTMTGIYMGFYFSMAKFSGQNRTLFFLQALLIPLVFHGFYDFFLMTKQIVFLLAWAPFFIWLIIRSFRKMKKLSIITSQQQEINDI